MCEQNTGMSVTCIRQYLTPLEALLCSGYLSHLEAVVFV